MTSIERSAGPWREVTAVSSPTTKTGDVGEERVVQHLQRAGFDIRDRNVSCRYGELDIVAEKGDLICFVEVRTRRHTIHGDPLESVSLAKQRKVVHAAMLYLMQRQLAERRAVRFDVAAVVGTGADATLNYIENAFDAGW